MVIQLFYHSTKWDDAVTNVLGQEDASRTLTEKQARAERRSTASVLPPGVAAKRRLRAFEVDVLVHI